MATVFVHGNPETPVIWAPLLELLELDDAVTLQLPGFGCAAPTDWGATKDEYAAWLIGELEQVASADGPVRLVGHDWGSHLSARAVSLRPDLVSSWVCDSIGGFHEDYVWHDFAQIWQTPGAGEEFFDSMLASPIAEQAALLESVGVSEPTASTLAEVADAEMARCVLALYRSAAQPSMATWGVDLIGAVRRPSLFFRATEDPFSGGSDLGPVMAGRLGSTTTVLEGQGHWWMLSAPEVAATALQSFWASL